MSPLGQVEGRDEVAQQSSVKRLRIIRVKHFQAATGDELASLVGSWFRSKKEATYTAEDVFVGDVELSEQRELVDWRYQVTGEGESVTLPQPGVSLLPTTNTGSEVHHIMLFYAE